MLMSSENRRNVSTNTSIRYSAIHRTLGTRLTVENKMADQECVLINKKLAEAVREFPILYDKCLKDFKDQNKNDLA